MPMQILIQNLLNMIISQSSPRTTNNSMFLLNVESQEFIIIILFWTVLIKGKKNQSRLAIR